MGLIFLTFIDNSILVYTSAQLCAASLVPYNMCPSLPTIAGSASSRGNSINMSRVAGAMRWALLMSWVVSLLGLARLCISRILR